MSIDKELATIKDNYELMRQTVDEMRMTLDEWNKDEEIQQWKDKAEWYRTHALIILTDQEKQRASEFRSQHCLEHGGDKKKAVGNSYMYTLTGVGIGRTIEITCPICGVSADITDYDCW